MATEVPASPFRVILWRDTTVRRAARGHRIETRWSMWSSGSSPSTTAATMDSFNTICPPWLSRKAVSAASRPVVMRTIVCRGARQVASTTRQRLSTTASATA